MALSAMMRGARGEAVEPRSEGTDEEVLRASAAVGLGCSPASMCDLVAGDGSALASPLLTRLMRAKAFILAGDRHVAGVGNVLDEVIAVEAGSFDEEAFRSNLARMREQ